MVHMLATGKKAGEGILLFMVDMEATMKVLVDGDTSPRLVDSEGAHELGRLRWEAEKDLIEEVVFIERILPLSQWRGWSTALATVASHIASVL
jgi:hypothetical protein